MILTGSMPHALHILYALLFFTIGPSIYEAPCDLYPSEQFWNTSVLINAALAQKALRQASIQNNNNNNSNGQNTPGTENGVLAGNSNLHYEDPQNDPRWLADQAKKRRLRLKTR